MGTIDSMKSILTQSALDVLCEKFHIPNTVHTELPGHNDRIRNSPAGWMSFSKRSDNAPVCYTKPLDSLKHWNDLFLWVDASVFPLAVPLHNNKTLRKDPPTPAEFDADVCNYLADNPAPFIKFPKHFLCFVGISRYYDLDENCYPTFWTDDDEEMDLFAFINHVDLTKVQIGEREFGKGEVPLLDLTKGRVVSLPDRKRKTSDGASGSSHPPKKLREDHGTSGHVGSSTGGKSLAAIQELFEQSTLNVEIGVTAAATVPFVTSSVTPTSERGDGGPTDSVSVANLRTQHPSERFVISSDSSHDSSANVADDEVNSIVRSYVPPPPLMTAAIATTVIAGAISALVSGVGDEPVSRTIFRDYASPSTAEADVAGPSQPVGADTSTDTFLVSQDLDFETLQQIYVPKWNVINDSALDDPKVCRKFNVGIARQAYLSAKVRLRSEHNYTERKKFERRCVRLTGLLKAKDAEVASLKAQLSLKEAEAAEAIRLCCQIATVEATELSCDELSTKAASLEFHKDKLIDQVSMLEGTCSKLCDEVSGYKLFKEQIKVVQDEQVKILSDKVAGIDADLMRMALHLDEELYPRFLTTIAGQRWILSRGLKLIVMKCLQSPEYLTALGGGAIGRAIDKGMQDGLAAGIDHRKVELGLVEVAAYNPVAEANYVFVMSALRDVDFPLLAQLASHKDASMFDLMDLLRLEDPATETPKANQLQPSPEQLMLPIHRLEDQVVIGETSKNKI
ncbi:hypothetical protein Tco_0839066 [Tanacetum coccineum]|uniref:Transposase (Putative), gypsy type n=1 Tax=Tanacetum coccineum TaxID=301880 RepID=A0ABQ5AU29_9ASTR